MTDAVKAAVAAQRVLIVEDDESARVGLTELVRTWGFAVEAAADGEAALATVTSFRPTIVVSDLVMPRMDGLALLAALGDDLSHIYFVLLTAQGTARKPGGLNKNLGIPAGPAGKLLKARAGAMVAASPLAR